MSIAGFMKKYALLLCSFTTFVIVLAGCSPDRESKARSIQGTAEAVQRIGYPASPLLGLLYAAEKERGADRSWELQRMGSGGDVGYALVSRNLDAGFIETVKAVELVKSTAGKGLKLAGAMKFPYGAVLVVRKGLNIRLDDLPGRKLAAEDADCKLLHQFRRDAQRLGVDLKRVEFSYVPFADMLPALEAGAIDGMITKGAYGVLAELQGHSILYQNWEIKPGGDACCPASLAQVEYFLVVREEAFGRLKPFIAALDAAAALPPSEIRRALSERLGLLPEKLGRFPVATFAAIDEKLAKDLGERTCLPR